MRRHRPALFALALLLGGALGACARFEGELGFVPDAQQAPAFTALGQSGRTWTLSQLRADGPLVLVFLRGFS